MADDDNRFFLSQGKVYLDDINLATGKPMGNALWVGNVPNEGLMIQTTTTPLDKPDNYSGQRTLEDRFHLDPRVTGTLNLQSVNNRNLALGLFGTSTTQAAATITDEPKTATLGGTVFLERMGVTPDTPFMEPVTGSDTYAAGTDYVLNPETGAVSILSTGTKISANGTAVKFSYAAVESEITTAFSNTNVLKKWLIFEGKNNVEGDSPVIFEIFKVDFSPTSDFSLISANFSEIKLQFAALSQPLFYGVTGFDRFFRHRQLPAA
jgi:hypothetical protein